MAKIQSIQKLSAETYIRTKVRQLPIYKCYKASNIIDDSVITIMVIRRHPQGTFSFGAYLIDRWCLGVKDSIWRINVDEEEFEDFKSIFDNRLSGVIEIDYVEAHNLVYGAVEFALDAGIPPCNEFALTKFFLEEDDENVELREYEFGLNGEYCLVTKNVFETAKYVPLLDKHLGKGNYLFYDETYEEEEADDFRYPFALTPSMSYTYCGGDYPKSVKLNYPKIESILSKEVQYISDDEIDWVLSLSPDMLREDLHNLILYQLGIQWGKSFDELETEIDDHCNIVHNALIFLTTVATVEETLPVVLEVMRQSDEFREYNFGDITNYFLDPVLFILIKDNPRLLKPFLLEPGLEEFFKNSALELLEIISTNCEEVRKEIIDMTVELLSEYKSDLTKLTICDGTVAAFAIGILVNNGDIEHLPFIEELYATNLIDESCEGHIGEVRRTIRSYSSPRDLPPMNPYAIRDAIRKFLGYRF